MANGDEKPEDRLLLQVRKVAAYVFVGLVALSVMADIIGPVLSDQYKGIGETTFGIIVGSLLVLLGAEGITWLRNLRGGGE